MGEEDVKVRFTKIDGQIDTLKKEIERFSAVKRDIYIRLTAVERNQEITPVLLNSISEKIKEIRDDIKVLKEKPSKRLDLIITGVIAVAISSVGNFLLQNIINK